MAQRSSRLVFCCSKFSSISSYLQWVSRSPANPMAHDMARMARLLFCTSCLSNRSFRVVCASTRLLSRTFSGCIAGPSLGLLFSDLHGLLHLQTCFNTRYCRHGNFPGPFVRLPVFERVCHWQLLARQVVNTRNAFTAKAVTVTGFGSRIRLRQVLLRLSEAFSWTQDMLLTWPFSGWVGCLQPLATDEQRLCIQIVES